MKLEPKMKATVEQIRQRFDTAVDQFSDLQTGQSAVIDAPFCLELVAQTAATLRPSARELLDVGCGAGNYTLKLLEFLPNLNATLVDLSRPMLDRAKQRVKRRRPVESWQSKVISETWISVSHRST
jgi:tRNA (cmo5U34)-methyltransferase